MSVPGRAIVVSWCADAGVFEALHREILDPLGAAGELDWSAAILDDADRPQSRRSMRTTGVRLADAVKAYLGTIPIGLRRKRGS